MRKASRSPDAFFTVVDVPNSSFHASTTDLKVMVMPQDHPDLLLFELFFDYDIILSNYEYSYPFPWDQTVQKWTRKKDE